MDELSSSIEKKLETLIKLVAMNAIKGREFQEQVRILDQAGLKPSEIASLLNKTPNNISVTLNYIRRKKKN